MTNTNTISTSNIINTDSSSDDDENKRRFIALIVIFSILGIITLGLLGGLFVLYKNRTKSVVDENRVTAFSNPIYDQVNNNLNNNESNVDGGEYLESVEPVYPSNQSNTSTTDF